MHNSTLLLGAEAIARPHLIEQLLNWSNRFGSCCFLDNHQYESSLHAHDFLLGAGMTASLTIRCEDNFRSVDDFLANHRDVWIFSHLSYDLKQPIHGIENSHPDRIGFPALTFFVPQVCVVASTGKWEIISQDHNISPEQAWKEISACDVPTPEMISPVDFQPRVSRDQYMSLIEKLRAHIHRGDCYEINFCQEFFAENVKISPLSAYQSLVAASPNPFSCFYKLESSYLMCASPERFLTRRGEKIFSQPIKGTAARHLADPVMDDAAKITLRNSPKELSENVMVVDLVRNDLSRICKQGSVQVDELFGVYSYPQVHQMTSTVSGTLQPGLLFSEMLAATFPMGSMTGAPKRRVMELIEQYEPSRRGLFSGAVGYFAPGGDFDFNVVIRSLLYNASSRYLSYLVGGGITWYSRAEQEYEECMLKASAIKKVLYSG